MLSILDIRSSRQFSGIWTDVRRLGFQFPLPFSVFHRFIRSAFGLQLDFPRTEPIPCHPPLFRAAALQGETMTSNSSIKRSVCWVVLGLAAFIAADSAAQQDQAPPPPQPSTLQGGQVQPDQDGGEALTRGAVHEAYAAPVVFNPKPGVVVPKAVPAPIEELPPDQTPEGDIVWINGYWSWDEDRQDFIWISGIWRDPPPGMTWNPGYWMEVDGGSQWIAGYWQQAQQEEVEFLPEPPQSLEQGPNIPQPDD